MKTLSISLLAAVVLLSSCTVNKDNNFSGGNSTIEAQGAGIEKVYPVQFNSIRVATGLNAEVIKSNDQKVVVVAPENIQDRIAVENSNGDLYVHYKSGTNIRWGSSPKVLIRIYAKDFNSIKATSSADIAVKDKFTTDKMNIEASSSGDITGDLEANELQIKASSSGSYKGKIWALNADMGASSSGEIVVSGSAKQLSATASSSGTVNAKAVQTESATLAASSSGDVSTTVSKTASATASSSGDVVIYKNGNPTISKAESSSGSVSIR